MFTDGNCGPVCNAGFERHVQTTNYSDECVPIEGYVDTYVGLS